jgi:hypothetical protein
LHSFGDQLQHQISTSEVWMTNTLVLLTLGNLKEQGGVISSGMTVTPDFIKIRKVVQNSVWGLNL